LNFDKEKAALFNNLLLKINWNNYSKSSFSNYICNGQETNNEDYRSKLSVIKTTSDGFRFYCIIKINNNYRILTFYEWKEFTEICKDTSNKNILFIMKELLIH
jgi:hypothetical protein